MNAVGKFIETRGGRLQPLLFLLVCILAFGLFIPFLGFYWDDWPTIFYTYNQRVGQLVTHFSYDRPFSVWGYWLIGRLGTAPLSWHLAALLVRWGCVVALAWALKPLWPRNSRMILFAGLLFAVYPGYYLQPSAVIFSSHLLAYLFFLVSVGCMGRAATDKSRFWVYTAAGLAAAAVHMFTLEYFVGLELIRPFYVWFLLSRTDPQKSPIRRTLALWGPYVLLLLLWVLWRLFLVNLPVDPYPLVMVSAFNSDPIGTAVQLFGIAVNDLGYILVSTWRGTVLPQLFAVTSSQNGYAWAFAGGGFLLLWWALSKLLSGKNGNATPRNEETRAAGEALVLGAVALIAGLMPVWLIGEDISRGDYNLRYMLVALLGAALLVVGAVVFFLRSIRAQILVLSLLVSLALGNHLRAAFEYRQDWEDQRAFFWQLSWRAPAIEMNTALVALEPVAKYLRDPMTGNALNVLYPTAGKAPAVGLWNFELNRTQTVRRIQNGELLENDYRGLIFSGATAEDLVFYYLPPKGCLWVLSPRDVHNNFLPTGMRDLVAASNTANILPQAEDDKGPPPHIFGSEPQHDWCYFFEKADLAAQLGDWPLAIDLMAEAEQRGLGSDYGFEWLPLLRAQAASGEWQQAIETSQRIHSLDARNDGLLCAAWTPIVESDPGAAAQAALDEIDGFAGCDGQ